MSGAGVSFEMEGSRDGARPGHAWRRARSKILWRTKRSHVLSEEASAKLKLLGSDLRKGIVPLLISVFLQKTLRHCTEINT